jgi:glycosyltransferase involved in cell wall biosynthesis
MKIADKLSCTIAEQVYVECESIKRIVVAGGICPAEKIHVLPAWSANSLDAIISPLADVQSTKHQALNSIGCSIDSVVLGFVGRIVKDKGVNELVAAFVHLAAEYADLHLLLVGPFEALDPISAETRQIIENHPRIHAVGFQIDVRHFLTAIDILVHPSYREGLPTSLLEASAMRIPVVATNIPGCVDAIDDGNTGILVLPKNVGALVAGIRFYLEHPDKRHEHGDAGHRKVLTEFSPTHTWQQLRTDYLELLARRISVKPKDEHTHRGVLLL